MNECLWLIMSVRTCVWFVWCVCEWVCIDRDPNTCVCDRFSISKSKTISSPRTPTMHPAWVCVCVCVCVNESACVNEWLSESVCVNVLVIHPITHLFMHTQVLTCIQKKQRIKYSKKRKRHVRIRVRIIFDNTSH